MNRAQINVDSIEQERRAIWIRIEPALESNLLEMLWLARAWFNLGFVEVFEICLLPVVRFGADGWDVQTVRGFHVRGVVKAADECVRRDVYCAFDVSVAPQRKIGEPAHARGHPKLHRDTGGRHRQIESVFELNLLRLGETELSGDVGDRLLGKHDRAGSHGANAAVKLDVFNRFRKTLQPAAILFEKAQSRPINLTIDEQSNQTFMTQHGGERELTLRHIKRGRHVAEGLAMNTRDVFVRCVTH